MKSLMRLIFAVVITTAFLLVGCAGQSSEPRFGMTYTSVHKPDLSFPTGTRFSWSPKAGHFHGDTTLSSDIDSMLRESIVNAMTLRGYQVLSSAGQYQVSYATALERALTDLEISKHFGLNPGLVSKEKGGQVYEKGTIVVDVSDPLTGNSLWRAAMQGYFDEKLSSGERRKRIERVVANMFSSFPRGN